MNGIIDMLFLCLVSLSPWTIIPTGLALLACLLFGPRVRTLCHLTAKWVGVLLALTAGLMACIVLRDGLGSESGGGMVLFGLLALLPSLVAVLALLACYQWRCRGHHAPPQG